MPLWGARRSTLGVVGVLVAGAVAFVASSLGAPEVPTFTPTVPEPEEVGDALVGPRTYTVDASGSEEWRYFDLSRGGVVERPGPLDWDLAFRRFRITVNGGEGFTGRGGVQNLGEVPFDSVRSVPVEGYVGSVARDSVNAVLDRWYSYSWTSHVLQPKPHVYAIRTADGRYGKIEIVGYYCVGAHAGCPTFRYVYQGGGGSDVATR